MSKRSTDTATERHVATYRKTGKTPKAMTLRFVALLTKKELATLARTLPNNQRDLALLMGVQGYRIDPSDETAGGLQAALIQTPPTLDRVIRYRSATWQPHLNASGRLLAVAGSDGVTVHDLDHASAVRTLPWPQPREFAVISGDDQRVAAGRKRGLVPQRPLRTLGANVL